MAAPYLRMTVAVFVILSVAKESHGEKADCITLSFRGSVATERILPFCHSEAKAEESHGWTVGLRSWDASHSFSMTVGAPCHSE